MYTTQLTYYLKHYLFIIFSVVFLFFNVNAQSDGCSTATPLSVTPTCSSPTSGTTNGATQTIPGCTGNADDDVWYSFVATNTSHNITVAPSANMDAVFQLFSGTCSDLVSLACVDNNFFPGGVETLNYSGLTIGTTYRIRVYHYDVGSGSGDFNICITPGASPPPNDLCGSAISLPINSTCNTTLGTLKGATESAPGCSGVADDDVWYSFVATASSHTITVNAIDMIDIVFEVFSGNCSGLTSIICQDNNYTKGGTETATIVGLSIGATYLLRVYDFYANNSGDFNICITGNTGSVPNDEPCNAIVIPPITSACNYLEFSNVGATASMSAPTPSSCIGGSGAQIGGFSNQTADVWFEITVPATGHINITSKPFKTGYLSDATMALYSGTCNSLTQITCSDDYNYPPFPTGANPTPSPSRFLPMINATGLTPGTKVYLRYWGFGSAKGKFGFCVTTGLNDDCENALYICDLNGYSASTSPSFTSDRPGNMHGNNETPTGDPMTTGVNSGGPFGYFPPNNIAGPYSSTNIDVEIDNNSWIRFTAASTKVKLNVVISDCFREGNRPQGGVQMQIFEYTGCGIGDIFTPVSNFKEGWGSYTIETIDPLVIGQDYILMVDGFAGDICNYTISAESGVKFPDIPPPEPICSGSSVTLTAPNDGNSYLWTHNNATTQSVTVNPTTTTTYSVQVEGLCGQRQTLNVKVIVKSPFIEITTPNTTICAGSTAILTASAGATNYLWTNESNTTIATTQNITVSPTSTSKYKVKATVDNCEASKEITITVAPPPTVTMTVSPKDSICKGDTVTLKANGASSYTWDNGLSSIATHNVYPTITTTYKVVGSNGNCSDSTTKTITVVPPPSISGTAIITPSNCDANTGAITGLNSSDTGVSYTWKNSANVIVGTTANINSLAPDTYTLTITNASGCTTTSTNHTVTTNSTPNINITSNKTTICSGDTAIINVNGANTYTWNHNLPSANTQTVYPNVTTTYIVTGKDANGCSATDSIKLTVNPSPSAVKITPDKIGDICLGDPPITLTASGADTYVWSTGSTLTTISVSPTTTTNYFLKGTDSNGCWANDTISIVVNALPSISGTAIITPSNCYVDNGTITGLSVSGLSPFLFSWTNASNVVVGTSKDLYNVPAGSYTLEIMDNNTCISTFGPISISNPPTPSQPDISTNTNTLCEGETATLSILSTYTIGTNFEWILPDGSLSPTVPLIIDNFSPVNVGDYCISATYLGCSSVANCISLSINTSPNVKILNSDANLIVCQDDVGTLIATGANSYLWSGPNNFLWSGSTIQISPFAPINEGFYIVEGKDINGCTAKDTAWLTFTSNPIITVNTDANNGLYCEHTNAMLTATGATNYTWSGPNNYFFSGSSATISDLTTKDIGWYYVTAIDTNNCSTTDSVKVSLSIPSMFFNLEDKITVCPGEDVLVSADIYGAFSYSWTAPNGYLSTQQDLFLEEVEMPNIGWYYLTVSDSIGCPQTDSFYLSVELKASCLLIPDLITPDGDMLNDTWVIPYIYYFPNVEVDIYNRWGNLIYHTAHYQNEWYGQINRNTQTVMNSQKNVPTGTYFFVMTLNDPQKTPPIKGYIDVQY